MKLYEIVFSLMHVAMLPVRFSLFRSRKSTDNDILECVRNVVCEYNLSILTSGMLVQH